jgi:hypothetical protein
MDFTWEEILSKPWHCVQRVSVSAFPSGAALSAGAADDDVLDSDGGILGVQADMITVRTSRNNETIKNFVCMNSSKLINITNRQAYSTHGV